ALRYESANYMQHLEAFVKSEGKRYQDLVPAIDQVVPRKAPGSPEDGLDGWSYIMRTAETDLALLYFENQAVLPQLQGFLPGEAYNLEWYDPVNGAWQGALSITASRDGTLILPDFPEGEAVASRDWAAKITR